MASSREWLAAFRREADEALEVSQKLVESTDAYEKVVKKSKKAAEEFHTAATSALSAADDLNKTVVVEKRIAVEFLSCAELMTEAARETTKAADHYSNSANHFKLEVVETNKQIKREIAKLPPHSLVVSTVSHRSATDCTTEPTEMESRSMGRRYQ